MRRYNEFKDSGIEWLGDIPKEWNVVPLKRISKRIEVGIAEAATHAYRETGVPILRATNIKNSKVEGELLYIDEEFAIKNSSKTIFASDIVTVRTGNAGLSAVLPQELDGSQCFTMLITTLKKSQNPFYFNYLLNSYYGSTYFDITAWGTAQKNISVPILQTFPVPQLPLKEQNAIVSFLDDKVGQIIKAIEKKKRLIELLQEEKTTIINQAATRGVDEGVPMKPSGIEWLGDIPAHWELLKLKNVAAINPTTKSFDFAKDSNDEVVFLPMEKVSEDGVVLCDTRKPISTLSTGYTYFEKNDVIVAKITPCFENGKGALLNMLDGDFGFGSTEFHVLRAGMKVIPEFLYFITKSELFMQLGEASMTGAAGQKRVPTTFISDLVIGVPNKSEQKKIVDYIKGQCCRIDITTSKITKEIELLEEYKQSLIYEVVTGKVKVDAPLEKPLEAAI